MKGLRNPEHPDIQVVEGSVFPFGPHYGIPHDHEVPEPTGTWDSIEARTNWGEKACFEKQNFSADWRHSADIESLACGAARDLCWSDKWTGNDVGSNNWWRNYGKWEPKKRCTDRGWKESDKVKCWPNDTIFISWSNFGGSTRAVTSLGKTCMYD